MPGPDGIIVAKPASPVVAMTAILGLAALGFELAGVGPEPEIVAADRRRRSRLERADPPAAVAVGAIDPAVQPQLEPVEPMLLVSLGKAREENLAAVGLAVAVGILGVKDIRAQAIKTPPRHGHDPVGNPRPSRKIVCLT